MKINAIKRPSLLHTSLLGIFILASLIVPLFSNKASAIDPSAAGFNPGNIIDDSVMTATNTMNEAQIQSFLKSKNSCNNTNLSVLAWHDATSGYMTDSKGNKYYYNLQNGHFLCMADDTFNGQTAAHIIWQAAQSYNINPEVLIVVLQKEQGLITDTWPNSVQYQSATGYGCPDTSACDSQYYGLANQVTWTAKMYHAIETANPGWYTPYILGNNYIQYNPSASCGGSTVNIQNRATQSLYNYTPYQPNDATLNAPMGATVSCGAYGNINFYRYFTQWFGSTTTPPVYSWSPSSQNVYQDSARTILYPYSPTVAPGQKFYVTIAAQNTGNQVWSNTSMKLAPSNPQDRTSVFYSSDWLANNRVSYMNESSVAPGGTATFNMTLTAPQHPGQYKEYFNLVNEGVTWLNNPGLYIPITVTPDRSITYYKDSARTINLGANPTVNIGSKVYARIDLTNNTSSALPANTALGTTNPNDRLSQLVDPSWISSNRVATLSGGAALQPGQAGSINFTLSIPSTPATYNETFGLVIDGTGGRWVENNTATVNLTAVKPPPSDLNTGIALNSGQALTSSDSNYHLVMQSDGNLVLYSPNRAVWASNTVGSGASVLVMQSDGNLVLYSPNRAVWASNTVGKM